jgi:hypothetical protein
MGLTDVSASATPESNKFATATGSFGFIEVGIRGASSISGVA